MDVTRTAASRVRVVTYRDELRPAFERLNRDWIETHFVLEDADREVFSEPRAKILAPGGQIFFVIEDTEVLGACAVPAVSETRLPPGANEPRPALSTGKHLPRA